MKKQLGLALGLAVLSTSGFASEARMAALGQDRTGSQYIEDSTNAFLNPASINSMKDYVIFEWGSAANTAADTGAAPNPEGGFFRSLGNFTYGVYFDNEDANALNARTAAENSSITTGTFLDKDNTLDLFFAGDAGIQWGVNFTYHKSENNTANAFEQATDGMELKLGVVAGDIEGFAHYTLSDEATGAGAAGDKVEDDGSMSLGVSYAFGNNKAFARYDVDNYKGSGNNVSFTDETMYYTVGVANTAELNDKARMVTSLSYFSQEEERKDGTAAQVERKTMRVPVVVALEADTTSWLTLRGSVTHNIIGETEGDLANAANNAKTDSIADSTDVAAGATLNFGNLKIDGSIGAGAGANELGVLNTDNLLTRVGLSYFF